MHKVACKSLVKISATEQAQKAKDLILKSHRVKNDGSLYFESFPHSF